MGKYASKVVEQAVAWLGYKESNGTHRQIIDVYNAHKPLPRGYAVKYTDAWCATFVSAVSIKLGYTSVIPTECSCYYMIELFKKLGAWNESDSRKPNPGDIIFYDWEDNGKGDNNNSPDHVGIVEKVSGNTITVIEGNYSKSVKRRTLAVDGKYIRGYGVPKYDKEQEATKKTVNEVAQEVLKGLWGNGANRERKLTAAGYDYDAVQAEVNRILKVGTKKSNTEIAKEVINGKWGNGADRKKRLTTAGYDYNAVQKEVNRILNG